MGISLSFSACERYLLSPMSFFLHYYLRLRSKEISSALYFGSALDEALNVLLASPLDRSPDALLRAKDKFDIAWSYAEINGERVILSRPEVIKYSKADLDESLLDEEIPPSVDRSWASLRVKGHLMLEAYAEQVIPRIKEVHAVQKQISLVNEAGDAFTGIIDLIATLDNGKTFILDNKSSSITYAKDAVETSAQLSTYLEAMRHEYNLAGAGYIVIPKKIRKQKLPKVPISIMLGEISEGLISETFQKYDEVLHGVKNGHFPCKPENCRSKPWGCGFEKYCRSEGKDLTGLVYHKERKK